MNIEPGGSLPVNILDDRGNSPNSCAVDPTTGSVAIVNLAPGESHSGNVVIFPTGSGAPVTYSAPNITSFMFAGYDPSGNLYVDGQGSKNSFQVAVLAKGSKAFVAVPLSGLNTNKHMPAGVQWDGQYVAVADALSHVVYRLAISGSSGKVAQTVKLAGWNRTDIIEFAIFGKKFLFPKDDKLLFYAYPAGGKYKGGFLGSVGSDVIVTNP